MPQARVKIIDFGVARATDSDIAVTTMQTDVGQIIGTLQYMSPEQCDADPNEIDTRSDVYSLGVVLYELLCGQLPYDLTRSTVYRAAQVIREEAPARPSTITGRGTGLSPVPRDAETIALKALEKDREKRYTSAADLAQDIRRHLNGEPIEASPPTAWTRGLRWVGRHPVTASATASLGIAAVILLATYLAVWFLNARPYQVVRYRAGEAVTTDYRRPTDEARLLSFNKSCLKTWGGAAGAIAFADLVERPAEFGGGKLVIVGYSNSDNDAFWGSLCAYEVDGNRDIPVWSRHIETEDLLPELRQERSFLGAQFTFHRGELADVFQGPEHPGSEVVCVFSHIALSQRIIRIYDLRGDLLYQVWHDGDASSLYWMADAGLLVFAGDNAKVNWDGDRLLIPDHNPKVVFALRPEPDHRRNDWMPACPGDGPTTPVWYKCLYLDDEPATSEDVEGPTLVPPSGRARGQFVQLDLLVDKELGGVRWVLDKFGDEVPNSRVVGDAYQIDQASDNPTLPDPDAFKLGPMPQNEPSPQAPARSGEQE